MEGARVRRERLSRCVTEESPCADVMLIRCCVMLQSLMLVVVLKEGWNE